MPNHVTNEIKIIGPESRVAEFFQQAKYTTTDTDLSGKKHTNEREFSFRGFIAPPDHPDYDSGGCSHRHPWDGEREDEHPNCWYVWNTAHWGTKWDAYEVRVGGPKTILDRLARADSEVVEETVQFDTAWSSPFPVFEAIAEQYPDCKFKFRWMNEDSWGAGGGYATAENGEFAEEADGINDPNDPDTGHIWRQLMYMRGHTPDSLDEYIAEVMEENAA